MLDYFKLAGVVPAWWTDSLADLKTLMERGFPGVIDGWIDAIADALDDDDNTGPAFDPFGPKLVLATMGDYLAQIADTRTEVARLKADKAALDADNAPDDLDDEELANCNPVKDLEREAKELRAEHRQPLKELGKLATLMSRLKAQLELPVPDNARARTAARKKQEQLREAEAQHAELSMRLAPVFAEQSRISDALQPYKETLEDLVEARKRYRALRARFLDELKRRCKGMTEDKKRGQVLAMFAEDLEDRLSAALGERRTSLICFVETEWDQYHDPLAHLYELRNSTLNMLNSAFKALRYA